MAKRPTDNSQRSKITNLRARVTTPGNPEQAVRGNTLARAGISIKSCGDTPPKLSAKSAGK